MLTGACVSSPVSGQKNDDASLGAILTEPQTEATSASGAVPSTTASTTTTTSGAATTIAPTTTAATTTAATIAPITTTSTTTPTNTIAPTTNASTTTDAPTTTASSGAATVPTPSTPPDTGDVSGFEIISAHLDDRPLLLALADTPALQSRGLMGVESMGALHGMVFVWEDPRSVSFWMKGTLIPLDIGFFDPGGVLFEVASMVPCTADPCPTYPSGSPARYALEAAPGFFDDVVLGASLTIGETVASR